MMRSKRAVLLALVAWVIVLFAAGIAWRGFHPSRQPRPSVSTLASRQDGYYLCLRRARMSDGEMRALIARRLARDDQPAALRGCREAQRR